MEEAHGYANKLGKQGGKIPEKYQNSLQITSVLALLSKKYLK